MWYTADIINDLDRAALAGAGAIAAITPHPTQWQSGELPDEVDVKDRLKPFYLRIIRSSHHPKLFYATFKTVEKAMHAKGLINAEDFVIDVFDCTRVDVTVSIFFTRRLIDRVGSCLRCCRRTLSWTTFSGRTTTCGTWASVECCPFSASPLYCGTDIITNLSEIKW